MLTCTPVEQIFPPKECHRVGRIEGLYVYQFGVVRQ